MASAEASYFISDLHLSEDAPERNDLFLRFVDQHHAQMQSLFILGDLFEAWIGDDDDAPWLLPVLGALRTLSTEGVALYFQHGNRDFLLGHTVAERLGMSLLSAEHVEARLGLLLCHGDALCTDDHAYQQFRAMTRQDSWQRQFLAQSLDARRLSAAHMRQHSKMHQQQLDAEIMDVAPSSVRALRARFPGLVLLHGHTHRPAWHIEAEGARIVLGDWRRAQPSWFRVDPDSAELHAHGWFERRILRAGY